MNRLKIIIQFILIFLSIILIAGENPDIKSFIITKFVGFVTIYIIAKKIILLIKKEDKKCR